MTRARIAVIGLGAIAQSVHLPLLRRNLGSFEIVGLVDLSAARVTELADAYGVPGAGRFGSVDELIAAHASGAVTVDGAILATTGSHGGDTLKLVRAGIKVLAEKPLAYSLREIEALESYAAESGIDLRDRIRVGYMKEHDPATERARELLKDVRLRAVSVEVLHPLDGSQLDFARLRPAPADLPADAIAAITAGTAAVVDGAVGALTPQLRTLYTNVVLGSIVHDIGLLRSLVGGIGEVATGQHWHGEMPGSVHLRGTLAQHDAPWTIDWHYIAGYPEYRETVRFHHEEGTIALTFSVPYVLNAPTVLTVDEKVEPLGWRRAETRWMQEEAFERELLDFAALLAGAPRPGASVAESADDIRVGQRMITALAASQGVAVDETAEAAAVRDRAPRA